ncbi:MAG: type II toxin-antitoxin system RelE/ParE family toxin [Gammaproteobacteria bacterium]
MLKIRFSLTAEHDLETIWRYTVSEWGLEQAEKYLALIEKGAYLLLDNPYVGQARSDVKAGYRALPVEKHLIFYRVSGEYIDVLGIPHERMDAKRHLASVKPSG